MEIDFFFDSKINALGGDDFNLSDILDLLNRLQERGIKVTIHDTAGWDDGKRIDQYLRAVPPSMYKKYAIRRIFGSARIPGWQFGRQVPAIIVSNEGKDVDVYPHKLGARRVTILNFLSELVSHSI